MKNNRIYTRSELTDYKKKVFLGTNIRIAGLIFAGFHAKQTYVAIQDR